MCIQWQMVRCKDANVFRLLSNEYEVKDCGIIATTTTVVNLAK